MAEYTLDYTAEEINDLLGKVEQMSDHTSRSVKVKTYSASFGTTNVPANSEKVFEFDLSELSEYTILARIPYLHNNGFIPATAKLGSVSDTVTSVRVWNTNENSAITSGAVYLAVLYEDTSKISIGTIPTASKEQAGVVKIGEGLEVSEDGVISTVVTENEFNALVDTVGTLNTKISNSSVVNNMGVYGTDLNRLEFQLYKSPETGTYFLQAIVKYGSTSKTINLGSWT